MLLNGEPLNSIELNSDTGSATPAPPDPGYVLAGIGYVWLDRVLVGGVDVSAQLVGGIDYDREEGAAAVGGFGIYLPPGPVVPSDWIGRTVTFDYITTTEGVTTEARRFTGVIDQPEWNSEVRVLNCECSDQLQQRVEALTVAQVDALVGGTWSADVFEPVDGRSHWDYALERLSSRTAALDCDVFGVPRVSSWYAKPAPDFVFGPGTTIDQSVQVDLAPARAITNRVELEVSFRYSRLWQRNESYSWVHPETDGTGGIAGFCNWRGFPSELPTIAMIEESAAGNGQTVIGAQYYKLPLTMPNPCGDGNPWINRFGDLLLGADWTGARRWVQTVTETYRMALATEAGQQVDGRIVQRQGYSVEIENEQAEQWEQKPITGGSGGFTDLNDEARRALAINCGLQVSHAELIASHREATVTWQVPTSMALGIDLSHTLEINDQGVRARGKCRRISGTHDPDTGLAITTLSIAVMRPVGASGANDALVVPPRIASSDSPAAGGDAIPTILPTQISVFGGPDYDPELDGFSGNADAGGGPSQFPRDMVSPAAEIPTAVRDERVVTGDYLYRVAIPTDLLELD
ncbi:hypothetical protein [Pseudomonas sp. Ga0074129]|uniref:hypothetical protein n=1 Tax=Pseudomonas sp. Ga0074129 TaxID=1752219 RepID=UPI000AEAE539|nr:hypothetical protein [Pseudomonas sp. Ga0074129]